MKNFSKQAGFTLIELVVVIVILGILAATAAPKFINLQDDARTATLEGVKASLQSAASLVYSKSLIKGNQAVAKASTPNVTVNSTTIDISYGYPLADYSSATGSWTDLIELDENDYTLTVVSGVMVIYPAEYDTPTDLDTDTCLVTYTEATAPNSSPEIDVVACE